MDRWRLVEYLGSALGVAGALWLALRLPSSGDAWLVWIASNVLLIALAWRYRSWGLLAMYVVYLGTSLLGAARYLGSL
jgi:nicotinamide riboside transporter PnuC